MRIVISGPPKTGNVWVKSILSHVYGLRILTEWPAPFASDFRDFIAKGQFPDGTIFHQHFDPTYEFLDAAASLGCCLVTMIRNPYDTFVSLYHYIQHFKESFINANDPGVMAIGKPIDHPDVLEFLRSGFQINLLNAVEWLQCNKSLVIRYEDLHRDTFGEIKQVTKHIQPIDDDRISDAIRASDARVMRKIDDDFAKHIRAATVGDWQHHLKPAHLEVFRLQYAPIIETLGYAVVDERRADCREQSSYPTITIESRVA